MNLILRVLTLNEEPLTQPIVGRFGEDGGTVGRSDASTLALPDPGRLISRTQARVSFADGRYWWLEDVGAGNPSLCNGRPLERGAKVGLNSLDELRIGGYRVCVELESNEQTRRIVRGRTITRPNAGATPADAPAAAALHAAAPFGDLLGGAPPAAASGNPFADLLGPGAPAGAIPEAPAAQPQAQRAPVAVPRANADASPPPRSAAPPPDATPFVAPPLPTDIFAPPPAQPKARLPDDFNPFAPPPPSADVVAGTASEDPVSALRGAVEPQDLGIPPPSSEADDALARFVAGTPVAGAPSDPLRMFDARTEDDADEKTQIGGGAASDHVPMLRGAYRPPEVAVESERVAVQGARAASSATGAPAAAMVANAGAGDAEGAALWQAFVNGAGASVQMPRRATPELMQLLGAMVHFAVEGILALMAVRAKAKNELRAQVTVIQARDNNPLKFANDASLALAQLLSPPARGFLAGPEAIRDALNDLQSHQIGTMAGIQAALKGVLARFDPALLESRLARHSMLDTLLPNSRKARLWDLYIEHQRAIREEAEESFHQLFGAAFVKAYEETVDRLEQAQKHR